MGKFSSNNLSRLCLYSTYLTAAATSLLGGGIAVAALFEKLKEAVKHSKTASVFLALIQADKN